MSKRFMAILTLSAAMLWTAPALMADHGDKGNKHGQGNKHSDDNGDQGWDRRDGYEYRAYGERDGRPPGWSRGKKTGWGNCGLPPGQAKKYDCRSYVYEGRPHYYYQDDAGRVVVRRPLIEVQGVINIH